MFSQYVASGQCCKMLDTDTTPLPHPRSFLMSNWANEQTYLLAYKFRCSLTSCIYVTFQKLIIIYVNIDDAAHVYSVHCTKYTYKSLHILFMSMWKCVYMCSVRMCVLQHWILLMDWNVAPVCMRHWVKVSSRKAWERCKNWEWATLQASYSWTKQSSPL